MRRILIALALLTATHYAHAAQETPEIQRPVGTPQAIGVLHALRTIPEACTRVQGKFTGNAAHPYAVDVVKSNPRCQARALLVNAADARPATTRGWLLNDVVRVPSTACPTQQAVLRVWRHPGNIAPPKLDAQGRSRVYLQDQMKAGQPAGLPKYALDLRLEGTGC